MKSYVFYDDIADYEAYDDVRAYLIDLHGETLFMPVPLIVKT